VTQLPKSHADVTYPEDIFTEPEVDPDTVANLGPLAPLAGRWQGTRGIDVHPNAAGTKEEQYDEIFEFVPIDGQTNGPQLLYGLRYHQHVTRPGREGTFHDQVGYLLWEPATKLITMTLAIPRAQVAMASGQAESDDAKKFTLRAEVGDPHAGIVTGPFLDYAFHTTSWEITFRITDNDNWAYKQSTMLDVHGREPAFNHTDACALTRIS